MLTYSTLDNAVLDLSALTGAERAHFDRCYVAYRQGRPWATFANELVYGQQNPLLAGDRAVSRAVYSHLLFRALQDLEFRLRIRQGDLAPAEGDDIETDPITDAEVPVSEAAREKGVTANAIYLAIERGDLLGTKDRPARVSRRSLARWTPNVVRQRAGQAVGARLGRAG